ncbi:MAG: ribonuclease Z [Candidatus Kariarchaeaceae archaeon]|jgi:ribonuclease Z
MTGTDLILTFLGTGASIPPVGRTQASFALRHASGSVLFDCGEGTQFALRELKVPTRKEFIICISHFHADHFLGIAGLLSSFELQGRNTKVIILGPPGVDHLVRGLLLANYIKITFPIEMHELSHGESFHGKDYTINAFDASHEARALSYIWKENDRPGKINIQKLKELGIEPGPLVGQLQRGKIIDFNGQLIHPEEVVGNKEPGRVIAYSGDSIPNEKFLEMLPDHCDVLVHEGTFPSDMEELANERGHSTMSGAARAALKANPKKLIITHISPRITNIEKELKIVQSIYRNTDIAFDGMQIIIPFKSR